MYMAIVISGDFRRIEKVMSNHTYRERRVRWPFLHGSALNCTGDYHFARESHYCYGYLAVIWHVGVDLFLLE